MFILEPFHDYAVVQVMPGVMQRISESNPDAPTPAWVPNDGKGIIALPGTTLSEGLPADAGTGAKGGMGAAVTTLSIGRVIWVGPGRWREGQFQVPKCKRGDLVLFMPRTVSYEFSLHGRSIKIVPWYELTAGVREVAADSAEWREFVAFVSRAMNETAAEAV